MRIESNIAAVIGRVNRLKTHDIPTAMKRALNPAKWRDLAYQEAQATLWALATAEQKQHVDAFLTTLKALPLPEGFVLQMRTPFITAASLLDFQSARAALSPADLSQNLFLGNVQQFEEWVTEWVTTEKNKDSRDTGKTDEEIGDFISYLMLTPNPTPRELAARQKLAPHIVDFIKRRQAQDRLDDATVETWLLAVLKTWRNLVADHFGEIFRREFRAVRSELAIT
jgi:hypothetical protein